jgi:hypothetical protein
MQNYSLKKKKVGGGTKSTFLALIPKEVNPATFTIFCIISLCNSTYQILEKNKANRMKKVVPKLVS